MQVIHNIRDLRKLQLEGAPSDTQVKVSIDDLEKITQVVSKTLRDEFAMHAIHKYCGSEETAQWAYAVADAMMKARDEQP